MYQTQTISELAKALAAAQAELKPVAKNRENPHFKSKYADLAAVVEQSSPVLAKHGLSVIQAPEREWQETSDGFKPTDSLTTTVIHISGEYIQFSTPLYVGDRPTAQAYGSAVSYSRRYAYGAALGIVTDEDDDGNAASEKPAARTTSRPAPGPSLKEKARLHLKGYVDRGEITKDHANFLWADYTEDSHAQWMTMVESASATELAAK